MHIIAYCLSIIHEGLNHSYKLMGGGGIFPDKSTANQIMDCSFFFF